MHPPRPPTTTPAAGEPAAAPRHLLLVPAAPRPVVPMIARPPATTFRIAACTGGTTVRSVVLSSDDAPARAPRAGGPYPAACLLLPRHRDAVAVLAR